MYVVGQIKSQVESVILIKLVIRILPRLNMHSILFIFLFKFIYRLREVKTVGHQVPYRVYHQSQPINIKLTAIPNPLLKKKKKEEKDYIVHTGKTIKYQSTTTLS